MCAQGKTQCEGHRCHSYPNPNVLAGENAHKRPKHSEPFILAALRQARDICPCLRPCFGVFGQVFWPWRIIEMFFYFGLEKLFSSDPA
jgi:hypothetical protein